MKQQEMFCYQCQETAGGKGCVLKGVCGKQASTARLMDLLLFVLKGVSTVESTLRQNGVDAKEDLEHLIVDGLFSTITNANFDDDSISARVDVALATLRRLKAIAAEHQVALPDVDEVNWDGTPAEYDEKSRTVGVLKEADEDKRSLKELTVYGLKGMAAYYDHAARLGYKDESIVRFMEHALSMVASTTATAEELTKLVLETGEVGVKTMALLDKANTESYGNPEATEVNIGVGTRPGILISGHDLADLEQLLEQTKGTGVDVYTHGEMLPAHYYPKFKQYEHFVGNYGNAWWQQREEFAQFNGPIVFSTNCIVPPLPSAEYKSRMFTCNSTAFPGCKHIETQADGKKDFSEVIEIAKQCKAPNQLEEGKIVGGFAHNQVLSLADKVVEAVKAGQIRRFVVMAGCDGRQKGRNYYTDFAQQLPQDTVILTAGCAKYRYNKLNLGNIGGIPRVLDAGQCNDSYSLALIALKLKEVMGLEDINELPISYNIAWYEQKAVIVLLALLSLGVKNIHTGPTLPAFLSPNVLKLLVEQFGLGGITTVEDDMKILGLAS